jgi:hypothetical protein
VKMALPVSERVDTYVTCQQRSAVVGMCSEKSWEEVDEDSKIDMHRQNWSTGIYIRYVVPPFRTYDMPTDSYVRYICPTE